MLKKLIALVTPLLLTGCIYNTFMLQSGVALTTLNECSPRGELLDGAGYIIDSTLSLGTVNRHGVQPIPLADQMYVSVIFRARDARGHLLGTATQTFPVGNGRTTYPVTWIIGRSRGGINGQETYVSDITDGEGNSVCVKRLGFVDRVEEWLGH